MTHTYSRSIQNKITRLIDYNLTNDFPHDWDENIDELTKLANEFNRPFSAGLTILLTHASYKGDLDDVKEKINFVCSKMAVSGIPVGASRKKTLKNWFTGVSAPDAKARRQLYELCFALSVSLEDICWFFNNVLFQRAFNCHQIEEAIYYYCFKNNYSYNHAQKLISEIQTVYTLADSKNPLARSAFDTVCPERYTTEIMRQLELCSTDDELKQYLTQNKQAFLGNRMNQRAKENFQKMLADIRGNATDKEIASKIVNANTHERSMPDFPATKIMACSPIMQELLNNYYQGVYDFDEFTNHLKYHDVSSIAFMLECIYGNAVSTKDICLPQNIRKNFPSEKIFSDLLNNFDSTTNYDAIRKCLILLKFYHFWFFNRFNTEDTPENLHHIYRAETDDLLAECGYDGLFEGNNYDRLFILCAGNSTPLNVLREFISTGKAPNKD